MSDTVWRRKQDENAGDCSVWTDSTEYVACGWCQQLEVWTDVSSKSNDYVVATKTRLRQEMRKEEQSSLSHWRYLLINSEAHMSSIPRDWSGLAREVGSPENRLAGPLGAYHIQPRPTEGSGLKSARAGKLCAVEWGSWNPCAHQDIHPFNF